MCERIHYLDRDDVPACGCTKPHPNRTFVSGSVTCPDCQRVLQTRRGAAWLDEVTAVAHGGGTVHARIASARQPSTELFRVGPNTVRVSRVKDGRWTFAVNDGAPSRTFPTAAAAWTAGVQAIFVEGPGQP